MSEPSSPAPSLAPSEDEDDRHKPLAAQYLGENSPTKRSCPSRTWNDVKRLKMQHPNDPSNKATHICVVQLAARDGMARVCNQLLTLHKNKPKAGGVASWLTTKANDHLKICHAVDSPAGEQAAKRDAARRSEFVEQALDFGMPDADGVSTDALSKFKLSKRERSLSAQAQWYTYSSMRVSKSEFDSIWF